MSEDDDAAQMLLEELVEDERAWFDSPWSEGTDEAPVIPTQPTMPTMKAHDLNLNENLEKRAIVAANLHEQDLEVTCGEPELALPPMREPTFSTEEDCEVERPSICVLETPLESPEPKISIKQERSFEQPLPRTSEEDITEQAVASSLDEESAEQACLEYIVPPESPPELLLARDQDVCVASEIVDTLPALPRDIAEPHLVINTVEDFIEPLIPQPPHIPLETLPVPSTLEEEPGMHPKQHHSTALEMPAPAPLNEIQGNVCWSERKAKTTVVTAAAEVDAVQFVENLPMRSLVTPPSCCERAINQTQVTMMEEQQLTKIACPVPSDTIVVSDASKQKTTANTQFGALKQSSIYDALCAQENEMDMLRSQLDAARLEGERLKKSAECVEEPTMLEAIEEAAVEQAPSTAELFALVSSDETVAGMTLTPYRDKPDIIPEIPPASELFDPLPAVPETTVVPIRQEKVETPQRRAEIPVPSPPPPPSPPSAAADHRGVVASHANPPPPVEDSPPRVRRRTVPTTKMGIAACNQLKSPISSPLGRPFPNHQQIFGSTQEDPTSSFFQHAVPQGYFEETLSSSSEGAAHLFRAPPPVEEMSSQPIVEKIIPASPYLRAKSSSSLPRPSPSAKPPVVVHHIPNRLSSSSSTPCSSSNSKLPRPNSSTSSSHSPQPIVAERRVPTQPPHTYTIHVTRRQVSEPPPPPLPLPPSTVATSYTPQRQQQQEPAATGVVVWNPSPAALPPPPTQPLPLTKPDDGTVQIEIPRDACDYRHRPLVEEVTTRSSPSVCPDVSLL